MKSIKAIAAALVIAALAACGGTAHAADFVTNSTGNGIYGAADAQIIYKDNSAGYNRVAVKYPTGYQFINDDGAWSVYAKLVAKLGANGVAVPGAADGKVVNFAKVVGSVCQGNTLVSFSGTTVPENLGDGCATFNAAKGASQ